MSIFGLLSRARLFKENTKEVLSIKEKAGTSLGVRWLRIRLPMQGTRVQAVVREDPTCHRAAKPVRRNY